MRLLALCVLSLTVAACGGGESASQNDVAAATCEAEAKSRLSGKPYTLDLPTLAGSMKPGSDGNLFLTAPIVIEPGLTSEQKQIVECTVRFVEGKPEPEVVNFVFNW